ncbi:S9 family peptidase [Novosphingobium sp. 9U]|uniref:alpha/beta hydrolase family protein n=1 Tax=Novosphingobium sp. 9U TaxID=2653158 RepID=UPI0012F13FDE|nr:S9 family peptidase [Novosphingobium sp. 9U]VWX51871.1 Peptidase S9 [Novosphingobium sp. 9U]
MAALLAQVSVAHAAPPPLEAYGNLPAVEAMAISPSGDLATVSRIKGLRKLLVVGADGSIKTQSDLGDSKVRGLEFPSDDTVLLHNSAASSLGPEFTSTLYEFSGVLIVHTSPGQKPSLVFGNSRDVGDVVFGSYGLRHPGGVLKGYYGGVELDIRGVGATFVHGRPFLYEVDLAHNSARKLARAAAEGHNRSWQVDENGQVAATLDIDHSSGRWNILNSGDRPIATGVDQTGDVDIVSLGRDGSTLIYLLRDAEGTQRYFEVPLAGGTAKEIFTDLGLARFLFDPANGRLLGYLNDDDGKQVPVLFDPAKQAAASKIYKVFAKFRTELIDWTPDFSQVLVRTSGNGDSGTFYKVDVKALKADAIGFERPLIEPEQVGPIARIAYKASDGLEMDGILTLPSGREARSLPVILMPHGGPHARDEPDFDWWAQAYASRGYAVFQPNFRGSTGRDSAFRNASANQWGRKMQTDISDGLAELARRGIVDPKRACIVGASYGGYAALAGVTLQSGIYRCAVAVAPVADLEMLYNTEVRESGYSSMTWRSLRKGLGDPKGYDAVSPRKHAANADAPVLLIHGKDDTVVPFQHSSAMAGALRAAGKPVELVVLRHEDHWLSISDTRLQMLTESLKFLQAHNPPE